MAFPRTRMSATGLLAAVLALISQIALGAMVQPDARARDSIASLDAASILCLGAPVPADDGPVQRHHPTDHALCPIDIAFAMPAAIVTPDAVPPPPPTPVVITWRDVPPGRGPPGHAASVGTPRGPPILA